MYASNSGGTWQLAHSALPSKRSRPRFAGAASNELRGGVGASRESWNEVQARQLPSHEIGIVSYLVEAGDGRDRKLILVP